MRNRIRSALIATLTLIGSQLAVAPVGAVVAPQKVVIIVGPTGAQTDSYRSKGDDIATVAQAAGATVVKVYSPNATWAAVKAAVDGANIVIYLGHGNGYPNPYNTVEATDRDNGWGLNRTTSGGDSDDWSVAMVYCGEKALRGTLTSSDGAAQRTYCAGGPITPAANWVMIYSNACYAPGASEGFDVPATESVAMQRVRNYSYPGLLLGGGAYFATDMGAQGLVDTILHNPGMAFGAIAESANGYDPTRQVHFDHPDLAGTRIWIQNTGDPTSGNYFFAYAGHPDMTPSGATVTYTEPVPPPPAPPAPAQPGATTYSPPVTLLFKMGAHTGYTFNSSGVATGQKAYSLGSDSSADTSTRATLPNQPGYWFYVTNGVWAGYWVQESSTIYLYSAPPPPPPSGTTTYNPPVTLLFKAGGHSGYRFDSAGSVTGLKSYTLGADSSADTSSRAPIPNQPGSWFYVTNGVWAGYWVQESSSVYLASAAPPAPPPSSGTTTYSPPVTLLFKMGGHTGYTFNSAGVATGQKAYSLGADSSADTSSQAPIPNQPGSWFYVTNGVWAGYWVQESSTIYLASATPPPPAPPAPAQPGATTYNPPVTLLFKMGGHTGYTFNSSGVATGIKSYSLGSDSSAATSTRATLPNQPGNWFYVTNGVWAGYWLQESSSVYLASS